MRYLYALGLCLILLSFLFCCGCCSTFEIGYDSKGRVEWVKSRKPQVTTVEPDGSISHDTKGQPIDLLTVDVNAVKALGGK